LLCLSLFLVFFLDSLKKIASEISSCKKCALHYKRNKTVPGEGPPNANIFFIGEAPGRDEDETGKPFIGRAGKLLTKALEKAGIDRKKVFITSIAKCRPPKNRKPRKKEAGSCMPYLLRQIGCVSPEVIVLLGNSAAHAFLKKTGVAELRGNFFSAGGKNFFVTFHPAACLYNSSLMPLLVNDLKKLKKFA